MPWKVWAVNVALDTGTSEVTLFCGKTFLFPPAGESVGHSFCFNAVTSYITPVISLLCWPSVSIPKFPKDTFKAMFGEETIFIVPGVLAESLFVAPFIEVNAVNRPTTV